jgi:hypothetical protein
MRPAFTTLTIQNGGKKLKVVGPIDLDGKESEAYIWLRVTQRKKGALPRVEGIGTADRDRAQLKQEFNAARTRLLAAVTDLDGSFGTGRPLVAAVENATAMWDAIVKVTEGGAFRAGELASVEAWALVRASSPTREFHVYWRENAVMVTGP